MSDDENHALSYVWQPIRLIFNSNLKEKKK